MSGAAPGRRCYLRALFAGRELPGAPELSRRHARFLGPAAISAVRAALGLAPAPLPAPGRVGIFSATGPSRFDPESLGAKLRGIDPEGPLWQGGLSGVDPFSLLKIMSSGILAVLAMALPAQGRSAHLCDDAVGGLAALAEAQSAVREGAIDLAAVVAYDDLRSGLARAELASGPHHGEELELAVLYLSSDPAGALGEVEALELFEGGEGPVGGAAGLARLVAALENALAEGLPRDVRIEVARGGARLRLLPLPAPPEDLL